MLGKQLSIETYREKRPDQASPGRSSFPGCTPQDGDAND